MASVQTSQLCSGLCVVSANTTCWIETDPCVFAGVCVMERARDFAHPEVRATDVGHWCLFKVDEVFV